MYFPLCVLKEDICLNCCLVHCLIRREHVRPPSGLLLIKIKDESMIPKPSIYSGKEIAEVSCFLCRKTIKPLLQITNLRSEIFLLQQPNVIDGTDLSWTDGENMELLFYFMFYFCSFTIYSMNDKLLIIRILKSVISFRICSTGSLKLLCLHLMTE